MNQDDLDAAGFWLGVAGCVGLPLLCILVLLIT